MKKLIMAIMVMAFALSGCTGDNTEVGDSISIDCGDGGCGDMVVGDGNTLHAGEDNQGTSSVDFDLDNFDRSLSHGECNDLGFFYCTIENECLPQPLNAGTCPNI